MTAPLDIRTPEGARAWGAIAARNFVALYAHHGELEDAQLAWSATATIGETFEAFALAFMQGTAEQLAAAHTHVLADDDEEARADIEEGVAATLRVSHTGHPIGQQEAARQALLSAARFGLTDLARQAAERLYRVQRVLLARGIRPPTGRAFNAFDGDA